MRSIYLSDPVHPDVHAGLAALGEVRLGYGHSGVSYEDVCADIEAVVLRAERFGRDKIASSPNLRIIARHGVGVDHVDIEAATEAGVWVTVAAGSNSRAVAEYVFALLLAVARRVHSGSARTAAGQWATAKPHLTGFELNGRTLGLVGFGNVARRVVDIAQGFGMHTMAHDPFVAPAAMHALGARAATLRDVVAGSDVLSLHLPLTEHTRHLIDATSIASMKPGAVLINTSRGGLVDENALLQALLDGHLGGAGLDVLAGESLDMKNPLPHSTLVNGNVPNLVLTPHVAGQTTEAFLAAGTEALTAIRQVMAGEPPSAAINDVSVSGVRRDDPNTGLDDRMFRA